MKGKAFSRLISMVVAVCTFLAGTAPALCESKGVVGQERLTASKAAAMRLYDLDDKMQANYAVTQRLVGESQSPVLLALFNGVGGKYVLRRQGSVVEIEPVPPLYQQVKSVSHTIVGVFVIVSPYFNSPGDNWKPKLAEFNKMLVKALETLDQAGMPEKVEKNCRTILKGGISFTGRALRTGKVTASDYSAYTKKVWPSIKENIELAAKLQVDHFEDVLTRWRKEMGEAEWSKLYAVVNSAWAMRRENVHFQILAEMMGSDAINDRLIMAESILDVTEDDLIMLLGRIINDRDLAVNVFGQELEYRMDVELMGEAARDEIIKKASPHHPVIDKNWMKYKENKMPNEE